MKSMYIITQEALEIASLLEEGELSEELESQLVISQQELQNKATNYCYIIKEFEDDVKIIDREIDRLEMLKKAKENVVIKLKDTVKSAMEIYGIEKIQTPTLKISFRKSDTVIISNQSQISSQYKSYKTIESIDKARIKQDIKAGITVEGAILQVNNNLQIK